MEKIPTLLTVVAALIVNDRREALVQQRPPGGSMAGLWEFPGGKVEPDETPEAALARELNEELGILVDPAALAPLTFASAPLGDRHLLLLLYELRQWEGELKALHASALRWADQDALLALPMPPADAPLLPQLLRQLGG